MLTKDKLKSLLEENVLSVLFKKKDGTNRLMLCTLKEDKLPKVEIKESKKASNSNTLPVWDLEKNEFRSFRIDSILEYKMAN